ncbi:hypothetical protein J2857_002285 [Neorhizobium galegae]|nr:hypothetical protein [Neorhizobium galegae]
MSIGWRAAGAWAGAWAGLADAGWALLLAGAPVGTAGCDAEASGCGAVGLVGCAAGGAAVCKAAGSFGVVREVVGAACAAGAGSVWVGCAPEGEAACGEGGACVDASGAGACAITVEAVSAKVARTSGSRLLIGWRIGKAGFRAAVMAGDTPDCSAWRTALKRWSTMTETGHRNAAGHCRRVRDVAATG